MPFTSAGVVDWFKKITGQATDSPLDMNISVGAGNAPDIYAVQVPGSNVLNLGPSSTDVFINFSVTGNF